jgi:oligosaccharide repeat unit polymerase
VTAVGVIEWPNLLNFLLEHWGFTTKLLIVVLGVLCGLPFVYQVFRAGFFKVEIFSPTIAFPVLYFAVFGLGSLQLLGYADRRVLWVTSYAAGGIIFYYTGVLVTKFKMTRSRESSRHSKSLVGWDPFLMKLLIGSFVIISVTATLYHAVRTGLPLFIPNIEEMRIAIQREITAYILFLIRLITPAVFFLLAYGFLYHGVKSAVLFFTFAGGLFIILALANRHDVFTYSLGSLLIYHFGRKNLNLKLLMPVILIGLLGLMAIGFYRLVSVSFMTPEKAFIIQIAGHNTLLMFLAYSLVQFTIYPLNFATYLDTFPAILPFEYGYSFIRAVSTVLPGHQDLLDEYVKAKLNLQFLGGGINPTILGELYANFGLAGILGMSLYGALITYLFYNMQRSRCGINVFAYSFALACLLLSLIGGFFSYFLYFYYIVVIVVVHVITRRKRLEA